MKTYRFVYSYKEQDTTLQEYTVLTAKNADEAFKLFRQLEKEEDLKNVDILRVEQIGRMYVQLTHQDLEQLQKGQSLKREFNGIDFLIYLEQDLPY